MRLERSELAVPASNWHMIEKGVSSAADVVFLDLEDSVAPDAKVPSRANVIRALAELDWGSKPHVFRMNALDTPYFYRDLIDIVEASAVNLDFILVPKVNRPEDVYVIDTLLTQIEASSGASRPIGLEVLIETAEGLINCERIARASPRVESLVFGPGDYTASLRIPAVSIGTPDAWDAAYPGHRFHYPMHRLLVAGRAAEIRVIDGPFADFRDLDGFRRACQLARSLGFDGKMCIHPAQCSIANEVFSPDEREIAWAARVVSEYEQATSAGRGSISIDGKMVDVASIKVARNTLESAHAAGIINRP
ncbi:MAG TPA: CoA ester lyase [Nitrolancea sp.]|nr:CoA ester lyase [Nitrolancea sp.]